MSRDIQRKSLLLRMISLLVLFLFEAVSLTSADVAVKVEKITYGDGEAVTKDYRYSSMVTLYIENEDGTRTPSGWSTRVADGAAVDKPFDFQPGIGLIQGWTDGVLQMREGDRAWLHVPSSLGYGARPTGSPGGSFYIPPNSNLLFDIEILGKAVKMEL